MSSPWPPVATGGVRWVFGHERIVQGGSAPVLEWLLRRNCSITPAQLLAFYASLCAVSLLISGLFLWQGAPFVLLFAGLELLVVGVALLAFARHAGDRETLTLAGRSFSVEQRFGSRMARTDFTAEWLSIEPAAGQGSLVQLSGEGRTVCIGRFVRPELRPALAQELRRALRRAPLAPASAPDNTDTL